MLRSAKDFRFDNATVNNKITDHVVQRRLDRPLLVDGMRHEIRLYLVIASVDPLIVFLNEEGLVTFDPRSKQGDAFRQEGESTEEEKLSDKINESHLRRTLGSYWPALEKTGLNIAKVACE